MKDIDNILFEWDSSNTILNKNMFLNKYVEDCLLESYMYFANKYENTSPILMQNKFKTYDIVIIKKFKDALIKLFNIPNTVKFQISYDTPTKENLSLLDDDDELKLVDDDSDLYYMNDDVDTNRLIEYINHQNIANTIVNGSALCLLPKCLKLIETDIDKHDTKLLDKMISYVEYWHYHTFKMNTNLVSTSGTGNSESITASEKIVFNSDNTITIEITGVKLVEILYEMLKGVIDLLAQWTFPTKLDSYSQKFIRAKSTDPRLEHWEWRFGYAFFNKFIKPTENLTEYYKNLFTLNYNDLLKYMEESNKNE